MSRPISNRQLLLHGLGAIVVSVALCYGGLWWIRTTSAMSGSIQELPTGKHLRFALIDHRGKPFTSQDVAGKAALVYFGYTSCPDICPTELGFIQRVLTELGPDAAGVQPLLITVDPERDTPEVLAGYAPMFHPRIIGLTGSPAAIASAAASVGAVFQKVDVPNGSKGYYLMNHSLATFLIGPDGSVLTTYTSHQSPASAAVDIRRRVAALPQGSQP